MYDYEKAIREDIEDALSTGYEDYLKELIAKYGNDEDNIITDMYDELFTEDSVTGNGSGSYTMNRAKAAEYLADNFELLGEAMEEFGSGVELIKEGPEACDVTIRCYLLGQALSDMLPDIIVKLGETEE